LPNFFIRRGFVEARRNRKYAAESNVVKVKGKEQPRRVLRVTEEGYGLIE